MHQIPAALLAKESIRIEGLVWKRIDILFPSHQIPNGSNVIDEEVAITSTIYDEGDGANGDGHEQDGILRTAARAIWGTLRPFVVTDGIDGFGECARVLHSASHPIKLVGQSGSLSNECVFTA